MPRIQVPGAVLAAAGDVTQQMEALTAQLQQVAVTAQAGVDAGANARQMVLTRDPSAASTASTAAAAASQAATALAAAQTLQQLADTLSGAVGRGDATHAELRAVDTALQVALDALTARVGALEAKTFTLQVGTATTATTLAINGTVALPVTWGTPFVNATGLAVTGPIVVPSGVALAAMTATISAVTRTGCTVTVKSNGLLLAAGQTVHVIAYRYGAPS